MAGGRQDEDDAVDVAVANLQLEPPSEGLTIGWVGLSLHAVPPIGRADEPIPSALIARSGEWDLDAPPQTRMEAGAKSSEQSRVPGISQR